MAHLVEQTMAIERTLVTGFEPFGGEIVNPSRDVELALLHQRIVQGRAADSRLWNETMARCH